MWLFIWVVLSIICLGCSVIIGIGVVFISWGWIGIGLGLVLGFWFISYWVGSLGILKCLVIVYYSNDERNFSVNFCFVRLLLYELDLK